jgi:membrane glycosyltransferase
MDLSLAAAVTRAGLLLGRGARLRRFFFFMFVALTAGYGVALMAEVLTVPGWGAIEAAILVVFAISFSWIALSFWAAVIGFALSSLRLDPITLSRSPSLPRRISLSERTAILMPIYNEDTKRVFAGIAATYRSLAATPWLSNFDVFILSDTTDADIWAAEEVMWRETVRRLDAGGRLFYRHRAENIGRKAGHILDWVQRWGGAYEHMIVLDADSVMGGGTLVRLTALMEANPDAGIIQTLAVAANRGTLFARVLQFASRLYGPLLAVGHSFWQLGEANYYGHNAIIRTRAFAAHCGLPKLSGQPPLGGEILSHDFVEAACIRRGGWRVWFMPALPESYEEIPSNLVDYAVRDRRWAQGNLQHARLIGGRAFHWVSRLHLLMGVLAFAVSPLWLLLLLLSSVSVVTHALTGHVYFLPGHTLFPNWPEYRPFETYTLLALTAALLFLPKLLGLTLALVRPELRRSFAGATKLLAGAIAELLFSVLLAPVMMLFHTAFVANILLGRSVGWGAQPRDDRGVDWASAARRHAVHTFVGVCWGAAILYWAPEFLFWIAPVIIGLICAIPLNVFSSRASVGMLAKRIGLFLTPEEVRPPQVLRTLAQELDWAATMQLPGFADLLSHERTEALHRALLGPDALPMQKAIRLAARAAPELDALGPADRRALLQSEVALKRLRMLRAAEGAGRVPQTEPHRG